MTPLGFFRKVALFEGLTTLALFFVAMPMKYLAGDPRLVPPVGMVHGIAFLIYLGVMIAAFRGRGFTAMAWIRTTAASFFPFGTFLNDRYVRSLEHSTLIPPSRPSSSRRPAVRRPRGTG